MPPHPATAPPRRECPPHQESRTAATPVPEGQSLQAVPDGNATVIRTLPKRAQHLAPRDRPQHTFFANAAYTAVISTLYLAESSSGSLNEGYDISAGYNWTSRGASAPESSTRADSSRPNATGSGVRAASTTSHRSSSPGSGPGRRWLFRESAGIGYGRYIRSYGDTSGSRGGVGIHESASVEFMLGRHIGLGAGISGQWLIVDSPDVDDGAELNLLGGIFRFQFGGGLRVYF